MNDTTSLDLFHLAMIQQHVNSLAPDKQVRVDYLAARLREILDAEPDIDVAHAALSLVSAEQLVAGAFQ